MASRTTVHDVARLAGVSPRTVSNVVNGFAHVAPETRERVQKAIGTLKYRPHVTAQRLRGGRTGILALALPEVRAPYFAELADRIQEQAHLRGATLLIDQTGGTRERELLVLEGYRSNLVDGVIFSPHALSVEDLLEHDVEVPMVLLGERIDTSTFMHIAVDNVAAACAGVEHLFALGHERIAAVGAPPHGMRGGPAVPRYRGYYEAMRAAGRMIDPQLVFETGTWTRQAGYDIADRIAAQAQDIDAVFCFNDTLALGLMRGLHDHGLRVPDDLSVLGWDDTEEARFSTPRLSTVAPDKAAIAEGAVAGLLLEVEGSLEGKSITADHTLIPRESTGRAARRG
jgi:LacI family transcriptional regulator, repressor for deo operon, udp, cdd, tsx, nupC, and nupG